MHESVAMRAKRDWPLPSAMETPYISCYEPPGQRKKAESIKRNDSSEGKLSGRPNKIVRNPLASYRVPDSFLIIRCYLVKISGYTADTAYSYIVLRFSTILE